LTWLVYIIGSAVGGRVSFNSNEDHDAMDGELVFRVLQLMNLTDGRLGRVKKFIVSCTTLQSKSNWHFL
jgi:exportin-7